MDPTFNFQNMRNTRDEILENVRAIRGNDYHDCLGAMVSLLTKADTIQYELSSRAADPEATTHLCELLAIAIASVGNRYGMKDDDVRFPELLAHARTVINSVMRAGTLTSEV